VPILGYDYRINNWTTRLKNVTVYLSVLRVTATSCSYILHMYKIVVKSFVARKGMHILSWSQLEIAGFKKQSFVSYMYSIFSYIVSIHYCHR